MFSNKIIDLNHFNPNLINYINDIVKNNMFSNIIVELENTKGLTSEMFSLITKSNKLRFRIKGGFNSKKTEKLSKKEKEEINEIITYTKDELYNIIIIFEKMTSGLKDDFNDLEKALYIYEVLKKYFNYRYYGLVSMKKEEDSLKAVLNKSVTSCGMALIYKEILDRLGINIFFTEGTLVSLEFSKQHFWNIIEIDGKFIATDLYLDNKEYNKGYRGNSMYFGNVSSFLDSHIPKNDEPLQYYENSLSSLNKQMLVDILKNIKEAREKKSPINVFRRKDNSEGLISVLEKEELFKMIYYEIENNVILNPYLLYLKVDFDINECSDILYNEVLDKTNIQTFISLRDGYLGILKKENGLFIYDKDENSKVNIKNNQKNIKRSDNTVILLEEVNSLEGENKTSTGEYNIYELLRENNIYFILRSTIYTEKNLFLANDQKLYDEFLSRNNLNKIIIYNNGYLEVFNPFEIKKMEKKEN